MGQQQLLLILIAVITTGVAIGLANQIFNTNTEEAKKDYISSELLNLGTLAQQFYNRPLELGGGNSSFKGWEIPFELESTLNGKYEVIKADDENVVLMGSPNPDSRYIWNMECLVKNDRIRIQILF